MPRYLIDWEITGRCEVDAPDADAAISQLDKGTLAKTGQLEIVNNPMTQAEIDAESAEMAAAWKRAAEISKKFNEERRAKRAAKEIAP